MNFEERIFCFWTGENPITERRLFGLETICKNSGCKVEYITKDTVYKWQKNNYPFHPAYEYLSAVHKADYLRCYFMYHYGGGYCDIKPLYNSWKPAFELIKKNTELWAVGFAEESPGDIANIDDKRLYSKMQMRYKDMIGTSAYIFRPKTQLALEWINKVHSILDNKYESLKSYPAPDSRTKNEEDSKYALKWTEILGNVFHPLCYKYLNRVSTILPKPDCINYQ